MRPMRSALYIPGSNDRALDKARGLPVDAILFDLEDAVAPGAKAAARDTLRGALREGRYAPRLRLVRINGLDTEWGADDLAALADSDCDGILVPKVDGPGHIDAVAERLPAGRPVWAMMETPRGVANAAAIADHPRCGGLVMGTNDLAKALHCDTPADRAPMLHALQGCVVAAKAAGVPVLDGVFNAFRDEDGLRRECEQGRAWGFDGKTLIHPAQVAVANDAFAPSPEAVDLARRQIAAHEAALAEGQGVAVLDGRIVENLHVESARRVLAKADAIAAMHTENAA